MLKQFTCTRVGFDKSLKINDSFDFKGNQWIIRAIVNSEIKNRLVKGFNGKYGRQYDVIVAEIVAQKVGTFDVQNMTAKTSRMSFTVNATQIDVISESELINVGEVTTCSDGRTYILTEIEEIKYSFVDIKMDLVGTSITEISPADSKKLLLDKKLNELGWKIVGTRKNS